MVTTVGLQADFISALKGIIELDYDAIEAYEAAITRFENDSYRTVFKEFMNDHQRHVEEISQYLAKHNETPPTSPSSKSILTKGKVILANLIGDRSILYAMRDNEIDTNTAYRRLNNYEAIPEEIKVVLQKGLQDEKRHFAWIEEQLS